MNERIKELAEQAGLKVESFMTNPPKPFQILGSTEQFEKFAELIVRECLDLCASDVDARLEGAPYETADEFDKGFIDGQDCCCEMIREHFGVEE